MMKKPVVLLGALMSFSLLFPAACSNNDSPGKDGNLGGAGTTDGSTGDTDSGNTDTGDSAGTGDGDGDSAGGEGSTSGSGSTGSTGDGDGDGDGDGVSCTLEGQDCGDGEECCSGICDAGSDTCTCGSAGKECLSGKDCCSGQCNPLTNTCAQVLGVCLTEDTPCGDATECCSLSCVDGLCSDEACTIDDEACSGDDECCSGSCSESGSCVSLGNQSGASCETAGNFCDKNGDCCSGLCNTDTGTCAIGASYCVQSFDACSSDAQCCGGACVIEDGKKLGYCAILPQGGTDCGGEANNGLLAGAVCDGDCDSCCSRTCAPYAPSGLSICQPAGGCRISGELCRQDGDCCGGEDGGTAFCQKASPEDLIGKCKYTGCAPDGVLCSPNSGEGLACGTKPPVNDGQKCCNKATYDNPVSNDPCVPDALLIPRCDGIRIDCEAGEGGQEGDHCATAQDCCDGGLCLQDESGHFTCSDPGDGGCQDAGEACSSNADCCVGSLCIIEAGQGNGVCGKTDVPDDGTGGMGGSSGAGGSDSGAGGSSSGGGSNSGGGNSGGSGGGDVCAAFGQSCATFDCCNGIPCDATTKTCRFSSGG